MSFTRASYSFAANGDCPAGALSLPFDGYPSGAAACLREMLLHGGRSSAEGFYAATHRAQYLNPQAPAPTDLHFRYALTELELVAEQRLTPEKDEWAPLFTGSLLDFIRLHADEPLLHATGQRAEGGTQYTTLSQLEAYLAEAQGEALRYEAGVRTAGGDTAAERVEDLRVQVLSALRAELLAGRVEADPHGPALKTFTVIAEMWDNEQGYAATVQAVDDDAAVELVKQQYAGSVRAAKLAAGEVEENDEDDEDEDEDEGDEYELRTWAVLRGKPDVIYLRDAA